MKAKQKAKLALFYARHRAWFPIVGVLLLAGIGYLVYTQFVA